MCFPVGPSSSVSALARLSATGDEQKLKENHDKWRKVRIQKL
jgi:hypothetical protein